MDSLHGGGVVIVGPGRVGLALAYALLQADPSREITVCGRQPDPPAHPIFMQGMSRYVYGLERPEPGTAAVFLAVPDSALMELVAALAAMGPAPERAAAFHMSGGLSTDILAPLHAAGYSVGSCHPLQVITHPVTSADRLRGSYFAVSGSAGSVQVARTLCASLGASVLTLPETWKPSYHAATTLVSGLIPTVIDAATRMLGQAGVPYEDAMPALVALLRGVLADIGEVGLQRAVGGPIAEGDAETVSLHLRALREEDRRLYALLGREVLRIVNEDREDGALLELDEVLRRELDR